MFGNEFKHHFHASNQGPQTRHPEVLRALEEIEKERDLMHSEHEELMAEAEKERDLMYSEYNEVMEQVQKEREEMWSVFGTEFGGLMDEAKVFVEDAKELHGGLKATVTETGRIMDDALRERRTSHSDSMFYVSLGILALVFLTNFTR